MGARRYPRAKVGNVYGLREVIAIGLASPGSNERVRMRCLKCGDERDSDMSNVRRTQACIKCHGGKRGIR